MGRMGEEDEKDAYMFIFQNCGCEEDSLPEGYESFDIDSTHIYFMAFAHDYFFLLLILFV